MGVPVLGMNCCSRHCGDGGGCGCFHRHFRCQNFEENKFLLNPLLFIIKSIYCSKIIWYKHTPGYMNFLNVPINHSELVMSHLVSGRRRFVM
jgi:hypothetical protein